MANTAETLAAIAGTVGAGLFVKRTCSFQGFLLLTSLLYFLAAVCYLIFSTSERVDYDETDNRVLFYDELAHLLSAMAK